VAGYTIRDGKLAAIYDIVNPDKIRHLTPG
jgi:hypothetical protein